MSAILQLSDVTGGYSVRKPVIQGIDFTVQQGEMIGLIGLNGAGKSTTIKHILGLLQPFAGSIRIRESEAKQDPAAYRAAYAYVPESPMLYEELTVLEHLRLSAMAYQVEESEFERRLPPLIERFQMQPHLDRLPLHLSKGMRQKVMIMNAFVVEPSLYIIDEPFLGLDPLGIRSLLDLMVEKREQGASILMSSHILSTLEKYCDRYVVLHHGRIIAQGTLFELQKLTGEEQLEDIFYSLIRKENV